MTWLGLIVIALSSLAGVEWFRFTLGTFIIIRCMFDCTSVIVESMKNQ